MSKKGSDAVSSLRDNLQNNIVYYLQKNKIKNKAFAEMLGVSAASVTNWISGKNSPDIELIAKMCDIFGVSITDMMAPADYGVDLKLSEHEQELVYAYRDTPTMRPAVDKLLGIDKGTKTLLKIARSSNSSVVLVEDDFSDLRNASFTDEDL